ncbi:hypothetical protein KM043_016544 [Ampulex compressa]|nr:hypothetical protein KM043_016544 [Ampulex compressa]
MLDSYVHGLARFEAKALIESAVSTTFAVVRGGPHALLNFISGSRSPPRPWALHVEKRRAEGLKGGGAGCVADRSVSTESGDGSRSRAVGGAGREKRERYRLMNFSLIG